MERLRSVDPDLLAAFPPEEYIAELDAAGDDASYRDFPPAVSLRCRRILDRAGLTGLELYHQVVLLHLIRQFDARAARCRYTDEVRELFQGQFRRILNAIRQREPGPYLLPNDSFCKDLGICRQRLIPCGFQLIECRAAIPRRWLLKGGILQSLRVANAIARAGGFRPFYNPHTDRRQLQDFNPDGWRRFHLRAAALMRLNPEVRGIMGATWWFDPQVGAISPRLRYLRAEPELAGALYFCLGENEHNTATAIANSPERYRAFEAGRYRPKLFGAIWLRHDLLRWAAALNSDSTLPA